MVIQNHRASGTTRRFCGKKSKTYSFKLLPAKVTHVAFIFLGVITLTLGFKTFVFHGFGVQGYLVLKESLPSNLEITK